MTTYTICILCFDDDSLIAGAIKSVEDCFDFEIKGFNNPPEFQSSFYDIELSYEESMTYSIPSYSDQDSLEIFTEVCQLSTGGALPAFILFSSNADGTSAELSIDPVSISYIGEYQINFKVTDSNSERGANVENIEG